MTTMTKTTSDNFDDLLEMFTQDPEVKKEETTIAAQTKLPVFIGKGDTTHVIGKFCVPHASVILMVSGSNQYVDPFTGDVLTSDDGQPILRQSASMNSYITTRYVYDATLKKYLRFFGVNGTRTQLSIQGALKVAVHHPKVFEKVPMISATLATSAINVLHSLMVSKVGWWSVNGTPNPFMQPFKTYDEDILVGIPVEISAYESDVVKVTGVPVIEHNNENASMLSSPEVYTQQLLGVYPLPKWKYSTLLTKAWENYYIKTESNFPAGYTREMCSVKDPLVLSWDIASYKDGKFKNEGSISVSDVKFEISALNKDAKFEVETDGTIHSMNYKTFMLEVLKQVKSNPFPEILGCMTEVENFEYSIQMLKSFFHTKGDGETVVIPSTGVLKYENLLREFIGMFRDTVLTTRASVISQLGAEQPKVIREVYTRDMFVDLQNIEKYLHQPTDDQEETTGDSEDEAIVHEYKPQVTSKSKVLETKTHATKPDTQNDDKPSTPAKVSNAIQTALANLDTKSSFASQTIDTLITTLEQYRADNAEGKASVAQYIMAIGTLTKRVVSGELEGTVSKEQVSVQFYDSTVDFPLVLRAAKASVVLELLIDSIKEQYGKYVKFDADVPF